LGAVDDGSKMKGQAIISVTLTDMQVGDKVSGEGQGGERGRWQGDGD
jgi:hypothetical protein